MESIVYVMLMIVMLMFVPLFMFIPMLKEFWKFKMAKKAGMGIFRLVGLDNRIKTYLKKVEKTVKINDGIYITDPEFIVYEKGVPVFTYFEGDSKPVLINLKKSDVEKKTDPKHLNAVFMRVKAIGYMQHSIDEKKLITMLMITMGLCFVAVAMVFKVQTGIDTMANEITTIKSIVSTLK